MQFTQAEYAQARAVTALAYAKQRGYDLVRHGNCVLRLREHDSMIFRLRDGCFFWNSRRVRGQAIELARYYEGLTLPEAVHSIVQACGGSAPAPPAPTPPPVFALPPRLDDDKPLYEYLHLRRGIDPYLLAELIQRGDVYLTASRDGRYKNAVFVCRDVAGVPRGVQLRGISWGSTFKGAVVGSDHRFPFVVPGEGDTVAIFESAIDALSHATIYRGASVTRLALGGNVERGTVAGYLAAHPALRRVLLCLDADEAGRRLDAAIRGEVGSGYTVETVLPPSGWKDWNEYLTGKEEAQ